MHERRKSRPPPLWACRHVISRPGATDIEQMKNPLDTSLPRRAAHTRNLVHGRYQQAVVKELDAGNEVSLHALYDHVEIIVGADGALTGVAALRRTGIDVAKVVKA